MCRNLTSQMSPFQQFRAIKAMEEDSQFAYQVIVCSLPVIIHCKIPGLFGPSCTVMQVAATEVFQSNRKTGCVNNTICKKTFVFPYHERAANMKSSVQHPEKNMCLPLLLQWVLLMKLLLHSNTY